MSSSNPLHAVVRARTRSWLYVFDIRHRHARPESDIMVSHPDVDRMVKAARAWCAEQFGEIDRVNRVPDRRWYFAGISFYFRDEIDATAFKIRWG